MLLFLFQKQSWFQLGLCTVFQLFALILLITPLGQIQADQTAEQTNANEIWDEIFSLRNDDEWRQLWHVEKHRRCYQDLENHMKWVCEKDIYKVNTKRADDMAANRGPFLSKEKAFSMLSGSRSRRSRRGIMDECCHGSSGCSWEEYAEYCNHHARVRA